MDLQYFIQNHPLPACKTNKTFSYFTVSSLITLKDALACEIYDLKVTPPYFDTFTLPASSSLAQYLVLQGELFMRIRYISCDLNHTLFSTSYTQPFSKNILLSDAKALSLAPSLLVHDSFVCLLDASHLYCCLSLFLTCA